MNSLEALTVLRRRIWTDAMQYVVGAHHLGPLSQEEKQAFGYTDEEAAEADAEDAARDIAAEQAVINEVWHAWLMVILNLGHVPPTADQVHELGPMVEPEAFANLIKGVHNG